MNKLFALLATISFSALSYANETITIGATPVPQAEILKFIAPTLAKQGYTLKITEFSDYITPNLALSQKQLDANFFQHQPYLNQYNHDHGTNLIPLVKVHLEPMGIYANAKSEAKLIASKKANEVSPKSKVGVPNDPTNEGRALHLLQANGFLKLQAGVAYPTKANITANPYQLEIIELDPAMLPRSLAAKQLDIAVINSNFALAANLKPTQDALFLETKNSPFVNIVAIRPDELAQPKIKALAKALNSAATKKFINDKYKGALVPAF
jgi:D-methionine transport system substrate-binding protein